MRVNQLRSQNLLKYNERVKNFHISMIGRARCKMLAEQAAEMQRYKIKPCRRIFPKGYFLKPGFSLKEFLLQAQETGFKEHKQRHQSAERDSGFETANIVDKDGKVVCKAVLVGEHDERFIDARDMNGVEDGQQLTLKTVGADGAIVDRRYTAVRDNAKWDRMQRTSAPKRKPVCVVDARDASGKTTQKTIAPVSTEIVRALRDDGTPYDVEVITDADGNKYIYSADARDRQNDDKILRLAEHCKEHQELKACIITDPDLFQAMKNAAISQYEDQILHMNALEGCETKQCTNQQNQANTTKEMLHGGAGQLSSRSAADDANMISLQSQQHSVLDQQRRKGIQKREKALHQQAVELYQRYQRESQQEHSVVLQHPNPSKKAPDLEDRRWQNIECRKKASDRFVAQILQQ